MAQQSPLNHLLPRADGVGVSLRSLQSRTIVVYAGADAFADRAHQMLSRLGYELLSPEDFARGAESSSARPDLILVDERRLGEIPDGEDDQPALPIIVLTGSQGVSGVDSRIAGAVMRRAGLHDLYRLLQQILEQTPRTTPRVPTHLRALCRRGADEWVGAVLSLSPSGCLLRSSEALPLGSKVELRFDLARFGVVEVPGEVSYQLVPDLGVVFSVISAEKRQAIEGFVDATLSA